MIARIGKRARQIGLPVGSIHLEAKRNQTHAHTDQLHMIEMPFEKPLKLRDIHRVVRLTGRIFGNRNEEDTIFPDNSSYFLNEKFLVIDMDEFIHAYGNVEIALAKRHTVEITIYEIIVILSIKTL
nr:hypothetical protein [Sphingobium limneticum]